jgi:hypothetical protein
MLPFPFPTVPTRRSTDTQESTRTLHATFALPLVRPAAVVCAL